MRGERVSSPFPSTIPPPSMTSCRRYSSSPLASVPSQLGLNLLSSPFILRYRILSTPSLPVGSMKKFPKIYTSELIGKVLPFLNHGRTIREVANELKINYHSAWVLLDTLVKDDLATKFKVQAKPWHYLYALSKETPFTHCPCCKQALPKEAF